MNSFDELPDSELRVRLTQRGVPDSFAVYLVDHREDEAIEEEIGRLLHR